jgi:hypothetical protein
VPTTTTTLPPEEICGNCLDDDGNGLADWEDPACCVNDDLDVLEVRGLRVRGDAESSKVSIRAILDGDGQALLDAGVREIFVQLAQDTAFPLTCARIDGARFR